MAYKEMNINWTELIQFTKNGVYVADYQEIRSAICNRFKEIYGQDIDLATTSADGIYVETLSLMINNILQSFKHFYAQLDVRTASGPYLDALCALSNVYRKSETHSTCPVSLTLDENATENYVTKSISLSDKNGNIWTCSSTSDMIFEPGVAQSIIVTCEALGPVRAEPGWIDRLVSNEVVMRISQTVEANVGSYSESDNELRARRNSSLGATGSTVLETLVGTLLDINGINDVKIYNNDSTSSITALDGTSIAQHDLYIVLRKKPNIEIADSLICQTIYEKLTPGIRTTASNGVNGVAKSYNYTSAILGQSQISVTQNVYWKQATPVKPKIEIKIKALQGYASNNNSTALTIASNVIKDLNDRQLSSSITTNDLWNIIFYSDPTFKGRSTFYIESIKINELTSYTLQDTYFDYADSDVKVQTNAQNITITIGG